MKRVAQRFTLAVQQGGCDHVVRGGTESVRPGEIAKSIEQRVRAELVCAAARDVDRVLGRLD